MTRPDDAVRQYRRLLRALTAPPGLLIDELLAQGTLAALGAGRERWVPFADFAPFSALQQAVLPGPQGTPAQAASRRAKAPAARPPAAGASAGPASFTSARRSSAPAQTPGPGRATSDTPGISVFPVGARFSSSPAPPAGGRSADVSEIPALALATREPNAYAVSPTPSGARNFAPLTAGPAPGAPRDEPRAPEPRTAPSQPFVGPVAEASSPRRLSAEDLTDPAAPRHGAAPFAAARPPGSALSAESVLAALSGAVESMPSELGGSPGLVAPSPGVADSQTAETDWTGTSTFPRRLGSRAPAWPEPSIQGSPPALSAPTGAPAPGVAPALPGALALDPDAIAELVNEALLEQAARNGVDLS